MPIFKIPYKISGECYVSAATLDDAIYEVEYADASDIAESNMSECKVDADEYHCEEVKGIPASARVTVKPILCYLGLHKWYSALIDIGVDGAIWLEEGFRCACGAAKCPT